MAQSSCRNVMQNNIIATAKAVSIYITCLIGPLLKDETGNRMAAQDLPSTVLLPLGWLPARTFHQIIWYSYLAGVWLAPKAVMAMQCGTAQSFNSVSEEHMNGPRAVVLVNNVHHGM